MKANRSRQGFSFAFQVRVFIFLILLAALFVACAPAPGQKSTQSSPTDTPIPAPTATLLPPSPSVGPTALPILSPESFAGIWKCCTGYELHTLDGSYMFEHTLPAMLNHGAVGTMTIEGDVLTVIEDSSDCDSSQVGKYRIELRDADTYHLTMIEDPCIWRAETGSAPLNGATLFRTKPLIPPGIYTKTITQAETQGAAGDLLNLVGQWESQLEGNIGKASSLYRRMARSLTRAVTSMWIKSLLSVPRSYTLAVTR